MHFISPIIVTIILILMMNYKGTIRNRWIHFIQDLKEPSTRKELLKTIIHFLLGIYIYELLKIFMRYDVSSISLLVLLLLTYIMIIIHELGHYLAAKLYKVPVQAFIVGNGPTLFKTKKVLFRLFPFTGYVKFGYMKKPFHGIIALLAGSGLQLLTLPLVLYMMQFISLDLNVIKAFTVITVSSVIYNLMPLADGCDGNMIIKLMKKDPQVMKQFIG